MHCCCRQRRLIVEWKGCRSSESDMESDQALLGVGHLTSDRAVYTLHSPALTSSTTTSSLDAVAVLKESKVR